MSAVANILAELARRGIRVRADGETLWLKPGDALDNELLARVKAAKAAILEELARRQPADALTLPAMPTGVRLVRYEPKSAPVRLDVCSLVFDVPKFIESELRALDSRLNNPWTIHGGFTVPQMLDRLAQAGMEVELEPKGGANE